MFHFTSSSVEKEPKEISTMYTQDVLCSQSQCDKPATYKIATPWSYGRFNELKSYGLACSDHYGDAYREAQRRFKLHPPSSEETVGEISIYRFEKGKHDRQLERLGGLDEQTQP
jgi:hypothetical protein